MFAAPQLYQVLGFGVKASLFNSVINNCVNLVATFGAIVAVVAYVSTLPACFSASSNAPQVPGGFCCSLLCWTPMLRGIMPNL